MVWVIPTWLVSVIPTSLIVCPLLGSITISRAIGILAPLTVAALTLVVTKPTSVGSLRWGTSLWAGIGVMAHLVTLEATYLRQRNAGLTLIFEGLGDVVHHAVPFALLNSVPLGVAVVAELTVALAVIPLLTFWSRGRWWALLVT